MTTSIKLQRSIKEQGRKKIWVAQQLGISRQLLDRKLSDNYFEIEEINKLKSIGLL